VFNLIILPLYNENIFSKADYQNIYFINYHIFYLINLTLNYK